MIEFGKTLRAAREAKGYTIVQLGDITHLAPSTIEDLENENFSRIAAPIYGRGFVKLYCAAVGLEVKPLVDEFMDIYQGNREAVIHELPDTEDTPPEPTNAPVDEPAAPVADVPPISAPTFDDLPPTPPSPPPPRPMPPPPREPQPFQPLPAEDATTDKTDPEPRLSRYATPLRTPQSPRFSPAIWRMGLLAVLAVAFLILLAFGIRALYHATGPQSTAPGSTPPPQTHLPAPAQPAPAAKTPTPATPAAKTPRTPVNIAPLYVD